MRKKLLLFCITLSLLTVGLVGCSGIEAGPAESDVNVEATDDAEQEESQGNVPQQEITFVEGSHKREDGYEAAFNTYYTTIGGLEVHIMNRVYEEASAKALAELVVADYQTLCAGVEDAEILSDTVRVYMVQTTLSGKPQVANGSVFCTIDDVESGTYRECLTSACLQAESYWKNIGMSAYLFGGTEETEALKDYYAEVENSAVLSMFPAFFSEAFADEATIQMAKQTAGALTKYMVDELGMAEFLETDELAKYRDAWLKSLGVEITAEQLSNDELHLMKYSSSEEYPVILEYENFTFYMKPVDWVMTADEAYDSVRYMMKDYEQFWVGLKTKEPEVSALLKENDSVSVCIYFVNEEEKAHVTRDKTIALGDVYALNHEVMHLLIPTMNRDYSWYYEGLVSFLTESEHGVFRDEQTREISYQAIIDPENCDALREDDKLFFKHVSAYYSNYAPLPENAEMLNFLYFFLAAGKTTFEYPELTTSLTAAMISVDETKYNAATNGEKYHLSEDASIGNRLTYFEATVCIEYLAEKYGLATVVSVAQDIALFEETFGDVETVIEEVRTSIGPVEENFADHED